MRVDREGKRLHRERINAKRRLTKEERHRQQKRKSEQKALEKSRTRAARRRRETRRKQREERETQRRVASEQARNNLDSAVAVAVDAFEEELSDSDLESDLGLGMDAVLPPLPVRVQRVGVLASVARGVAALSKPLPAALRQDYEGRLLHRERQRAALFQQQQRERKTRQRMRNRLLRRTKRTRAREAKMAAKRQDVEARAALDANVAVHKEALLEALTDSSASSLSDETDSDLDAQMGIGPSLRRTVGQFTSMLPAAVRVDAEGRKLHHRRIREKKLALRDRTRRQYQRSKTAKLHKKMRATERCAKLHARAERQRKRAELAALAQRGEGSEEAAAEVAQLALSEDGSVSEAPSESSDDSSVQLSDSGLEPPRSFHTGLGFKAALHKLSKPLPAFMRLDTQGRLLHRERTQQARQEQRECQRRLRALRREKRVIAKKRELALRAFDATRRQRAMKSEEDRLERIARGDFGAHVGENEEEDPGAPEEDMRTLSSLEEELRGIGAQAPLFAPLLKPLPAALRLDPEGRRLHRQRQSRKRMALRERDRRLRAHEQRAAERSSARDARRRKRAALKLGHLDAQKKRRAARGQGRAGDGLADASVSMELEELQSSSDDESEDSDYLGLLTPMRSQRTGLGFKAALHKLSKPLPAFMRLDTRGRMLHRERQRRERTRRREWMRRIKARRKEKTLAFKRREAQQGTREAGKSEATRAAEMERLSALQLGIDSAVASRRALAHFSPNASSGMGPDHNSATTHSLAPVLLPQAAYLSSRSAQPPGFLGDTEDSAWATQQQQQEQQRQQEQQQQQIGAREGLISEASHTSREISFFEELGADADELTDTCVEEHSIESRDSLDDWYDLESDDSDLEARYGVSGELVRSIKVCFAVPRALVRRLCTGSAFPTFTSLM
jgi:hypothetical protein